MTEECTVVLHVEGMNCEHCVAAISERFTSFPGVISVSVSLEKEQVVIRGSDLDPQYYARETNELGYTASVIS